MSCVQASLHLHVSQGKAPKTRGLSAVAILVLGRCLLNMSALVSGPNTDSVEENLALNLPFKGPTAPATLSHGRCQRSLFLRKTEVKPWKEKTPRRKATARRLSRHQFHQFGLGCCTRSTPPVPAGDTAPPATPSPTLSHRKQTHTQYEFITTKSSDSVSIFSSAFCLI